MFPYEIFNSYAGGYNKSSSAHNNGNNFNSNIDSKLNDICSKIARAVLRSRFNEEYVDISSFKIPKELVVISSLLLLKAGLFWTYRNAQKIGLDITEI